MLADQTKHHKTHAELESALPPTRSHSADGQRGTPAWHNRASACFETRSSRHSADLLICYLFCWSPHLNYLGALDHKSNRIICLCPPAADPPRAPVGPGTPQAFIVLGLLRVLG